MWPDAEDVWINGNLAGSAGDAKRNIFSFDLVAQRI